MIIPLIDARRLEVYTAVYDGKTGKELSKTDNIILDENSFQQYSEKKILFVGDGCAKAKEIITLENTEFRSNVYPSAQFLIKKSVEKFKNNDFEDVAYFEPFYLKDFHGIKKSEKA